ITNIRSALVVTCLLFLLAFGAQRALATDDQPTLGNASPSPSASVTPTSYYYGGGNNQTGGGLDCNGYSPISPNIRPFLVCADPFGTNLTKFYDNGYYIGHDEPAMQFFSTSAG